MYEGSFTDDEVCRFERVSNGVDWGLVPRPLAVRALRLGASGKAVFIFEEHSANKMMPADTGAVVMDALTFADEEGEKPYFHDQIIWCDDTPDSKVQMATWNRELGIRVHPARKNHMRRLSYEWLAGLREIVIDPVRYPLTFVEFTLKEYLRDCDGNWIDEIPDGNDQSIDAVRYVMMDDVLRG